jgi:hypothetical protein
MLNPDYPLRPTHCSPPGKYAGRHNPRRRWRFGRTERGQHRRILAPAVVPLCLAVQGCGSDPVGCDPCFTSAVVYGTIADSLGRAVTDVPVEVLAHVGGCETPFRGFMNTTANSGGRYRALAGSLHSPFTADCFAVTANVNGDPRWPRGAAKVAGRVEFRAELDRVPRDSIRLDLVLGTR